MGDEQMGSAIRMAIYGTDRPLPAQEDPGLEAEVAAAVPLVEKACGDYWHGDYRAAAKEPDRVRRVVGQAVSLDVVRLALLALEHDC
ncbi:hypothetical protein GCM10020369_70230 [Cryptosporangium minutisporangium]|uniref:Uncharacterized protein n=2 Tax=Cryptosporangium minutisporangium TaxID=113569 RepID=A0ABP6T8F9_9ACTN